VGGGGYDKRDLDVEKKRKINNVYCTKRKGRGKIASKTAVCPKDGFRTFA
jgi:hypothetical protein